MVLQGIDVFDFSKLKDFKVALIVNYSSVNSKLEHILDISLKEKIKIVKVFIPEHGFSGLPDGENVKSFIHPKYKIPIISLYGKRKALTDEDLEGIEIFIFDIQTVGLRWFTFIYTLSYLMKKLHGKDKKLIILDRVNPLGRKIQGKALEPGYSSFLGDYELPIFYGLTNGELALYFKKYMKLDINLEIVKVKNWKGETFDKTELLWNIPSPNLPTFNSLLAYSGMAILEGTNLSHGRGTTKPFEFIGAPWLNNDKLFKFLKEKFPKLLIRKREFVPVFREYSGKVCYGIEFFPKVEDDFLKIALEIVKFLMEDSNFRINKHFYELLGIKDLTSLDSVLKEKPKKYIDFIEDLIIYR